jgi:hypothetical protein
MVFTPLATNRAFRLAAGYRSRGGRAKARNGNAGGQRRAMSCEKRISYSRRMDTSDPLLERVSAALAAAPGVVSVVLGGSRAVGAAHASSDTDTGLYFSERAKLDVERLRSVVRVLVDEPKAAQVTEVGGWGPWIVGGGWLTIGGQKVDLLYRPIESVERVIRECREGRVSMDYQPGHPHSFCSATWMGEVAICAIARLKAMTAPYPEALREALIRRFQWEILFSIENARTALPKGDATTIAGCGFRSLACAAQVLFAVNRRYVINEKGALAGAARLPLTVANLTERVKSVWQAIGLCAFDVALTELGSIEHELAGLVEAAR